METFDKEQYVVTVKQLKRVESELDYLSKIVDLNLKTNPDYSELKEDIAMNRSELELLMDWMQKDDDKKRNNPLFQHLECDPDEFSKQACNQRNYLNYMLKFNQLKTKLVNAVHEKLIDKK